jgi:hypothetical protein
MSTNIQSELRGQGLSGVPLLSDWRAVVVHRTETRAGRYIISRFSVPPSHADLIAALAGLGSDR